MVLRTGNFCSDAEIYVFSLLSDSTPCYMAGGQAPATDGIIPVCCSYGNPKLLSCQLVVLGPRGKNPAIVLAVIQCVMQWPLGAEKECRHSPLRPEI